ncbi:MAG: CinA family nicotinamide mononucleotide deamidase-related protein, partial [Deltaproteobacteria bacterium]|nr:CinA family nicotinamide mononucleotide deamidase-related protein [Deltaproteobacteria bacterium]
MVVMRIEIFTIGDELLDGRVVDSNTARLAARLAEHGLTLAQRTSVPDDIEVIVREAKAIIGRGTSLCVVSGGLGPTRDDLTAEAFAKLGAVPLVRDQEQVLVIEAFLTSRGRTVSDNQRRQADRPQGSTVIPNPRGTAPGFVLAVGGCRFAAVPGVPYEFDGMVEDLVLAPLAAHAPPRTKHAVQTFGLIEAEVDHRLSATATRWPSVRLGFRVKFPEIEVTLSAPVSEAAALAAALAFAKDALGQNAYGEGEANLAATLIAALKRRGATLAVAESCTGGLIGDLLTDISGASDVLAGGIVAYANAAKTELLGVEAATLAAHGSVSRDTALEMAEGARARFSATYGIAATGIAGPSGGSAEKPVGTVFIAACGPGLKEWRRLSLPFDRRRNKVVSAYS